METLIVEFSETRSVIIEGTSNGSTNLPLSMAAGHYTVKLNGAQDYSPDKHEIVLKNTNPLAPMRIMFTTVT